MINSMTARELIDALTEVPKDCILVKNQVGNLAIISDDEYGSMLGYVDLSIGETVLFDQEWIGCE